MEDGERETLAIALDHAWRWYEDRRGRSTQLLQLLLLWLAILGTAYGVALKANLYGIGGFLGLLTAGSLLAIDLESARLRASAELAAEAITEMQERLADALGQDTLCLNRLEQAGRSPSPRFLGLSLQRCMLQVGLITAIVGAIYTWVVLP